MMRTLRRQGPGALARKTLAYLDRRRYALFFRPHVVTARLYGEELRFWLPEAAGGYWYEHLEEAPEPRWVVERLLPGTTLVDCGAHYGLLSLVAARRVPGARVVAVEASPATFDALRRNVELNGTANVEPVFAAVSDREGTAQFARESIGYRLPSGQQGTAVREVTIDALVSGERVSVLKIDVEGDELRALRGAAQTLARWRPALDVEVHPWRLAEPAAAVEEMTAMLRSLGYELRCRTRERGDAAPLPGNVAALAQLDRFWLMGESPGSRPSGT